MSESLRLYSYWRSSAAYRVRIGLNLKRLAHEIVPVHLVRDGGQQHAPDYRALNPQQLVPALRHGHRTLTQSLAKIQLSGIPAVSERRETDSQIVLTITIPK